MKQPDRQSAQHEGSEATEAAEASAHRRDSAPDGVLCQVCGEVNGEDQEYCRRCHHKLLVISGPVFEEDMVFEHSEDDGFSFDEHLLERISILEEVVKRSAESLRQLLAAVKKQLAKATAATPSCCPPAFLSGKVCKLRRCASASLKSCSAC